MNIVGYFGGTYESAKTDDRKEFNRMLTFVKRSKNINYVIVYSYERFSRSGIAGASIADDLLKKYGVITLATTQELDPTTPSGSFQQKILFLFGQMDNELRRDKVITGMRELLASGYWLWAPPRGYKDLNKGKATERKLVVNEEGKILKKAFKWKAYEQLPNVEIASRLNRMGLEISEKRLIGLFANPFYCGLIISKMIPGQVIEGKHEPLISRELFLMVHNIRQEKRSHSFVHDRDNENLPLKVFVKCDKCRQTLTGYLVKKRGIGTEELHIVRIQLEEQMAVFFKSQIEEAKSLKNKLTEIERKLGTIEERFVLGEIDRTLYDKFRPKYEKECFEIKQELNKTGGYKRNLKKVIKNGDFIKFDKIPAW